MGYRIAYEYQCRFAFRRLRLDRYVPPSPRFAAFVVPYFFMMRNGDQRRIRSECQRNKTGEGRKRQEYRKTHPQGISERHGEETRQYATIGWLQGDVRFSK